MSLSNEHEHKNSIKRIHIHLEFSENCEKKNSCSRINLKYSQRLYFDFNAVFLNSGHYFCAIYLLSSGVAWFCLNLHR